MSEKSTKELADILGKTHLSEFDQYCKDHKESMKAGKDMFSIYIKNILSEKGMTQQAVFLKADIPEQRDVILRICYAAELSLAETQRALQNYEMPVLYAKIPRDALLMIIFNERPGSIIEVNALLKENNMAPLRTSGSQD